LAHAVPPGDRRAADRAAVRRLDQSMPRMAAEQVRAERAAALSDDPQAVPQGCGIGVRRLAAVPGRTLRDLRHHGVRGGHHSILRHAAAVLERRRRHRARRAVRDGARLHVPGRHGRGHGIRNTGRTPRDAGRLSRRAGTADGDLPRLADLGEHRASGDFGGPRDARARAVSQPGVHWRRLPAGAARGECAHPGRQPGHPSRTHDDPRGDAARVFGAASRPDGVVGGSQAAQLRVYRLRAVPAMGSRHGRSSGTRRAVRRPAVADAQAGGRRLPARHDRDCLGQTAHLPRPRIPRDRFPVRGARPAGAPPAGVLMNALAFDLQLLNTFAALLLLTSFSMLSQRRVVTMVNLLALQGLLLGAATLLLAWRTGQGHLYVSGTLTLLLKAMFLPWLLHRLIRRLGVYWDSEPLLNIAGTMLVGLLIVIFAFGLAQPIAALATTTTRSSIGIAVAVVLLAFLTMITRRKAMSQVVGFLSMENGLFFGAMSATYGMPMIIELGVALDILVAMLVLGVFFFQIREQFDSLDLHHLESLKEEK